MIKIPPYLKKGDLIGITCPSSKMDLAGGRVCAGVTRAPGATRVHLGITVGTSFHNFSAPDELRLEELQDMLDDPEIKAIIFGRGGYGMVCILDKLDFSPFPQAAANGSAATVILLRCMRICSGTLRHCHACIP